MSLSAMTQLVRSKQILLKEFCSIKSAGKKKQSVPQQSLSDTSFSIGFFFFFSGIKNIVALLVLN